MLSPRHGHKSKSSILDTNTIESVLENISTPETLVIFDVDNTLVTPGRELGSDAWISWMARQQVLQGKSTSDALQHLFALFSHVHNHIPVYPVEQKTPSVLQALKEQAINTITLTGRPYFMVDRTDTQLTTLGYVFNVPEVLRQKQTIAMNYPVGIGNGIICSGINDKGNAIDTVFQQIGYSMPRSIVFVDDKKSFVESVGYACSKYGIDYTGIRYGHLDEKISRFDESRAQQQLDEFLSKYTFKNI